MVTPAQVMLLAAAESRPSGTFYRVVGGDDALFRHAAIDGIAGVFFTERQSVSLPLLQ
ncbi:hypothetical protein [Klebsiella pneumoniae IS43]|uniref:Uncharacterized protein n=1 Tax=Klebsiella pneumoniae IS43 TaxID=1432552 RepID=W1DNN6_KLEPN|nr:hypothetical protein [Klebsiella pneumoniae IS43]